MSGDQVVSGMWVLMTGAHKKYLSVFEPASYSYVNIYNEGRSFAEWTQEYDWNYYKV